MTDVLLEAGTLTASEDTRSVSGLLLPYSEIGRSNLGRFSIAPEAIAIPADPSIVTLNVEHNREEPIGRATALASTEAGITATFSIARTPEGDAFLADVAEGRLSKLSAEVKGVVLRAGQAIAGSLFGAAAVAAGAFPSAALMAADTPEQDAPATAVAEAWAALTDEQRAAFLASLTTDEATASEETPEADDEAETNEGDTMADATAPATLTASAPEATPVTASSLFASMARARRTGDGSELRQIEASQQGLFALADVTEAGQPAIAVPAFVGEIWDNQPYARKFAPLIGSSPLTSMRVTGWRWSTKPAVARYAGNKAAIPSTPVATEPYTLDAFRVAGGNDIDRKFVDFGDTTFLEGYSRALAESYARLSDGEVLEALVDGATAVTPGAAVAGIPAALSLIVDGALAIIEAEATPTFAIVSTDLWRDLVLAPKDARLEYLSAATGLTNGNVAGFQIVPSSALPAETVIVGDRSAATLYELGGGAPIRIEGLDIARGGVDFALFGYLAVGVHAPEAIVSVTAA